MLVHNAKAANDLLQGRDGTARLNTTHNAILTRQTGFGLVWFDHTKCIVKLGLVWLDLI